MDYEAEFPDKKLIEETWPLSYSAFIFKYTQIPKVPLAFGPKECKQCETHIDYYISPRKIIRYVENQGSDYTYASNFNIQSLLTLT